MDFQRLAVFRAVAQHLSFSRAAEVLHLSQPAISKHIRQLEADLQVQLFHRVGRRVELTDAGHILADYAHRVSVLTDEVRKVFRELEGLDRGHLRLAASSTPGLYVLPALLARFAGKHPGIEVSLNITNSADVARRISAGEVDLGFVGAPGSAMPGLQVRPWVDDQIILIVPPRHALLRRQAFSTDLLARETLIVREAGSATREIIEAHLSRLGVSPRRRLEITGPEAVKRAVAAGLGVGFISRKAVALEIASKVVLQPDFKELNIARPLSILSRKDMRHSPATLAFLALAQKVIASAEFGRG